MKAGRSRPVFWIGLGLYVVTVLLWLFPQEDRFVGSVWPLLLLAVLAALPWPRVRWWLVGVTVLTATLGFVNAKGIERHRQRSRSSVALLDSMRTRIPPGALVATSNPPLTYLWLGNPTMVSWSERSYRWYSQGYWATAWGLGDDLWAIIRAYRPDYLIIERRGAEGRYAAGSLIRQCPGVLEQVWGTPGASSCSRSMAASPARPKPRSNDGADAPRGIMAEPETKPVPRPPAAEEPLPWLEELPPRQIVAELDRYIVGQEAAKKAVAIAIRNRWRRSQAPDEIRDEILPNNIIMIGPTGVGKTEIARRLARLAGAPFVKVEASKFTEVGLRRPRRGVDGARPGGRGDQHGARRARGRRLPAGGGAGGGAAARPAAPPPLAQRRRARGRGARRPPAARRAGGRAPCSWSRPRAR